eukprot:scaffold880_cov384-Prasinococcus_capsulatus_cf.AAC.2
MVLQPDIAAPCPGGLPLDSGRSAVRQISLSRRNPPFMGPQPHMPSLSLVPVGRVCRSPSGPAIKLNVTHRLVPTHCP